VTSGEEVFVFPASFAQQRLWFLAQLVPENPFYNMPAAIRLSGSLDLAVLEQTFNEIIRRHEVLRTTFTMIEGQLMQIIAPHSPCSIAIVNLQNLPASEREEVAQQQAIVDFQKPFDLSSDSLIRITLFQLDRTDYILLITLHHIVADGWSIGILVRELGTLYAAFLKESASLLPDLPIQYADFAHWQREFLQEKLEPQLSYWQQQLADLPTLDLPSDRSSSSLPTYQGATQQIALSRTLTEQLETLGQQSGTTLFMTLFSTFQILLYRYTGQVDIAVGSPIANRSLSELEELIGFFVNTLVLRVDLSGNPTFQELLKRVQTVTLNAYAHQDLPFEKLVEALQPTRDLSRNPLFQVAFSLQNTPIAPLSLPGLTLSLFEFDPGTTRFDLEFHCFKDAGELNCRVVYSTERFEAATVTRMLQHFQILLTEVIENPNQRINQFTLLTLEEKQLLTEWNKTHTDYPEIAIHQQFERQVSRSPDAIAAVFADQQLTYRELNQRANQLAHYLQKIGVGSEVLVGLLIDRSLEALIAILAIWKAGGAYLPLDPAYPIDRLHFMLENSQIGFLITQLLQCDRLPVQNLQIINLEQEQSAIAQFSTSNLDFSTPGDRLAYVLYTSGSTGQPKGVLVEHRGLSNLAHAQRQIFNLQPHHRVLQFASLSFDASIFELVMALTNGASLHLIPSASRLPDTPLLQFLRDHAITHATLPPAVLAVLTPRLPALETVISAGEACSAAIVDRWAKHSQFFNAYGPTEATIWTTIAQPRDRHPPIGRPIANTQIYLLDPQLQLVPIGVTGELYIAGAGVARGYLNRPELTAERFIANPFATSDRLYKTGDLARYRSDGQLEFIDRIDRQVKIRGFRIELGEIEATLQQHPAIKTAVVTVQNNGSENKRLVAYVVSTQAEITADRLQNFLRSQLPDYLIPSAFVRLDALPLTPNGKVNLSALPAAAIEATYVAPRTATEATLAQIWAELLHQEQVGIRDNFFALGGDSILTVRLIDRIRQQFQQNLPLSSLFLNPTIEGLALALQTAEIAPDSNQPILTHSPLVPLQPAGSNPPFFCIHPIFGVVFPYCQLAHHLSSNQPFYGLQPLGLNQAQPAHTRIEEMAAYYLQALKTIQPQGPYFLGGWSFGGLVAFEMAQQLQRSGESVALLALFDASAPIANFQPSLLQSLGFLLKTAIGASISVLLDYLALLPSPIALATQIFWKSRRERSTASPKASFKMLDLLPKESRLRMLNELAIYPMLRVFQANSQAVQRYIPQTYPHSITLFRTAISSQEDPSNFALGWNMLTPAQVEVHQLPGNHFSILRSPHVEDFAKQLQACIDQALLSQR
jgi:amino acid adenylation domain-containing protein